MAAETRDREDGIVLDVLGNEPLEVLLGQGANVRLDRRPEGVDR